MAKQVAAPALPAFLEADPDCSQVPALQGKRC